MNDTVDPSRNESEGATASGDDWPVDVQRTDPSGEVDLGQLEFNLSLTPAERLRQNDNWIAFIHIARGAGRQIHGEQTSA